MNLVLVYRFGGSAMRLNDFRVSSSQVSSFATMKTLNQGLLEPSVLVYVDWRWNCGVDPNNQVNLEGLV